MLMVCMLTALLAGCAGRQGDLADMPGLTMAGSELTESERAILAQNKGSIARSVPDSATPLVEAQASYFLHRGRRTMEITSKRAEPYLAYARSVFRSRGMPQELAYLAIVESGYNREALSRAGAGGAWQFMRYTGLKYGLAQDRHMDERMDIYRATEAAADYLMKLYRQFGDWPTAIAAYNAGEGKVSRACEAAGANTFFGVLRRNDSLDEKTRLKPETLQYVPRFLAVTAIMENLAPLGFKPVNPEQNAAQVVKVQLRPNTDLCAMADACGMSWKDFQQQNPHFLGRISHPSRTTSAYVPSQAGARAIAFASRPVRASRTAVAQSGKSTPRSKATDASRGGSRYTLRAGDTLFSIARAHNTSVASLLATNDLADPNAVRVGQVLTIPSGKAAARGPADQGRARSVAYSVQPKDNLWKISRKLNVSVDELMSWNRLTSEQVHVGQTLVVLR